MSFITTSPFHTTEEKVRAIKPPAKTKTWDPTPHGYVIDTATRLLEAQGLEILEANFSMKDGNLNGSVITGANMFGEFILKGKGGSDFRRVVGTRNSICQDFPVAFCGGEQVTVCDNMCFSGDFMVSHKHTSQVRNNLEKLMEEALHEYLASFHAREAQIDHWRTIAVDEQLADHVIMEARRQRALVSANIEPVINEFRKPRHDEFKDPTVWNLHNAYTEIQKTRQCDPNTIASETIVMTDVLAKMFPTPEIKDAEVVLN